MGGTQETYMSHPAPFSLLQHFPIFEQWEALDDLNALVRCMNQKQVTKPSDKFTWATDSSLFVLVNKMFKIGLDSLSL